MEQTTEQKKKKKKKKPQGVGAGPSLRRTLAADQDSPAAQPKGPAVGVVSRGSLKKQLADAKTRMRADAVRDWEQGKPVTGELLEKQLADAKTRIRADAVRDWEKGQSGQSQAGVDSSAIISRGSLKKQLADAKTRMRADAVRDWEQGKPVTGELLEKQLADAKARIRADAVRDWEKGQSGQSQAGVDPSATTWIDKEHLDPGAQLRKHFDPAADAPAAAAAADEDTPAAPADRRVQNEYRTSEDLPAARTPYTGGPAPAFRGKTLVPLNEQMARHAARMGQQQVEDRSLGGIRRPTLRPKQRGESQKDFLKRRRKELAPVQAAKKAAYATSDAMRPMNKAIAKRGRDLQKQHGLSSPPGKEAQRRLASGEVTPFQLELEHRQSQYKINDQLRGNLTAKREQLQASLNEARGQQAVHDVAQTNRTALLRLSRNKSFGAEILSNVTPGVSSVDASGPLRLKGPTDRSGDIKDYVKQMSQIDETLGDLTLREPMDPSPEPGTPLGDHEALLRQAKDEYVGRPFVGDPSVQVSPYEETVEPALKELQRLQTAGTQAVRAARTAGRFQPPTETPEAVADARPLTQDKQLNAAIEDLRQSAATGTSADKARYATVLKSIIVLQSKQESDAERIRRQQNNKLLGAYQFELGAMHREYLKLKSDWGKQVEEWGGDSPEAIKAKKKHDDYKTANMDPLEAKRDARIEEIEKSLEPHAILLEQAGAAQGVPDNKAANLANYANILKGNRDLRWRAQFDTPDGERARAQLWQLVEGQ